MVRTNPIEDVDDANKKTNDSEASAVKETNDSASKTSSNAGRSILFEEPSTENSKKSTSIKWEVRMDEPIIYKEKNGNCIVPQSRKSGLGFWVLRQRQSHKKGKLSQKCTTQLEDNGFSWNKTTNEWENRFKDLDAYKKKNGNCSVPQSQDKLRNWMSNQRRLYKMGKLSQTCTTQQKGIVFVWDLQENQWKDRFNKLVVY